MKKGNHTRLLERFFEGKATAEELDLLSEQISSNEFDQKWMDEQWKLADEKINPIVQQQMLERIRKKIRPASYFSTKHWMGVAATITILVVFAFTAFLLAENRNYDRDMTITVAKGQKADLLLPDGSRVWINSGSTLKYGSRFNKKERMVQLEGEAYFEVAENKDAPFTVHSDEFSVKALGTAFDIKAYPDDDLYSVVLVQGRIEAGDENNKLLLTANQKIIYNRTNKNIQKTDVYDGRIYAGWINNQLSFESETFEEIASTLERNYNVSITFETESLKDIRYSGTLNNNSLESILQILSLTSPLSYRLEDSHIYIKEDQKQLRYYRDITNYH